MWLSTSLCRIVALSLVVKCQVNATNLTNKRSTLHQVMASCHLEQHCYHDMRKNVVMIKSLECQIKRIRCSWKVSYEVLTVSEMLSGSYNGTHDRRYVRYFDSLISESLQDHLCVKNRQKFTEITSLCSKTCFNSVNWQCGFLPCVEQQQTLMDLITGLRINATPWAPTTIGRAAMHFYSFIFLSFLFILLNYDQQITSDRNIFLFRSGFISVSLTLRFHL